MVIFHSYVSLPEGNPSEWGSLPINLQWEPETFRMYMHTTQGYIELHWTNKFDCKKKRKTSKGYNLLVCHGICGSKSCLMAATCFSEKLIEWFMWFKKQNLQTGYQCGFQWEGSLAAWHGQPCVYCKIRMLSLEWNQIGKRPDLQKRVGSPKVARMMN